MKEHSPTRIARAAAQALLLTQVAAVAPAAAATAPAAPAELKLKASTDRENPLDYAVGETISFNFRLDGVDALPEDVEAVAPLRVIWTRTGDDGARVVGTNAISLAEGFSVETKLGVPGMVRLVGKLVDCGGSPLKTSDGKEILFEGGAGAETEKMRLSTVEPADFDAFWAKAKARLAAVPFADGVELQEVFPADASAWTLEHYAFYAAKVPCFGPRPVTGWLVVPKNAAPHSLAVSAQFAGYGCTEVVPKPPKWGTPGKVFFDVNAHGYDLVGHDDAWFKEFRDSIYGIVDGKATRKPYALEPSDYDNPADTYLYYMALRVVRAFDYLKTRPEWNGRDIEASGGSQGGLQTMWAGGPRRRHHEDQARDHGVVRPWQPVRGTGTVSLTLMGRSVRSGRVLLRRGAPRQARPARLRRRDHAAWHGRLHLPSARGAPELLQHALRRLGNSRAGLHPWLRATGAEPDVHDFEEGGRPAALKSISQNQQPTKSTP